MTSPVARAILLLSLMILAMLAAGILRPVEVASDRNSGPDLETVVPTQFGEWRTDATVVPVLPNPSQVAMLNEIYAQTVSRTYVNPSGQRVMLSIAYGGNQSRALQVHKPEVCYASQGFQVSAMSKGLLDTHNGHVPVMRLVATQGQRVEPITYWIRVGDQIVRGWYEQNLARISYGLRGEIPDGMLVRVSTISRNSAESFTLHESFVSAMLQHMRDSDRAVLLGTLDS